MKNVLKWLFTHEPAIVAGIIAGLAVFFAIRYGTKADGAIQGTTGALVTALFGVLRNFVTSPATKQALAAGPGQLEPIASDVSYLSQFIGEAVTHPGGLYGLLASHAAQITTDLKDLIAREKGIAQPVVTVGSPSSNQPQAGQDGTLKPVTEPSFDPPAETTTPAPDALTELAGLIK